MSGAVQDYLEAEPVIIAALKAIVAPQTPFFIKGDGSQPTNSNGSMSGVASFSAAVAEIWTISYLGSGSWSVTGSVSGAQAPAATGVAYSNAYIGFTISAGSDPFVVGDFFTLDSAGFANVGGSTDMKQIYSGEAASPAAYVVFAGDKVDESARQIEGDGKNAINGTAWYWWVVVAVKDSSDVARMQPARAIAGPLIVKVLDTLRGLNPLKHYEPMRRANSGAPPVYTDDGYAYFPLKFILKGVA